MGSKQMEKLILRNCEIIFANLVEKDGFKQSITIKVTDESKKQISDFWKEKNIGKTNTGVPNFKEYEGTLQFNIPFNESTKFAYLSGLNESNIGFGSRCDMTVNAFVYNNKFTGGKDRIGSSISAVVITKGRVTGADADLNELLAGYEAAQTAERPAAVPAEGNNLPF